MNGIQIERVLDRIDCNVHAGMQSMRAEILDYLRDHQDDLAREISEKGYGEIPTRIGSVRITREDVEAVYA